MRPADDGGDGRRGMRSRLVLLIVVAAVVVIGVMSGLGVIEVPYLFSGRDATRLVVADGSGDCRKVGRDTGERCDPGADIETVTVWRLGQGALMAELELTEAPDLGPDVEWTADFFSEAQNAFTDHGIICGLSNVVEGETPGTEAVAYALEFRFSTEQLGAGACDGRLEGSSARFTIDVTGQPDDAEFRLVGVVRLEYPDESDHPGSEDDFLVRTTLADLPR